jgi:hypothetical protein
MQTMANTVDIKQKPSLTSTNWFARGTFYDSYKVLKNTKNKNFDENSCFEVPKEFLYSDTDSYINKTLKDKNIKIHNTISLYYKWNNKTLAATICMHILSHLLMLLCCFMLRESLKWIQSFFSQQSPQISNYFIF